MEKRERRERHRRSQVQNQRHQGGYGNRDNRDNGDGRRDTRESRAPPVPKPIPNDQKVIDHTAIPDPHMFDNLKRETDDIAALQVKKHGGKRQIFSNWAKYEIPPEDPEEDQAIGADFETLRQGAQLGSHLQLRSERSWDPKGLPAQSAAFTIDLGVLAAALTCLPLYEKLELPLDVFSTDELEHMERQARFGWETWRQRSAKGAPQQAKEGLALYGSILEKLTGSPSSDNALGTTNATKEAEREKSPDNVTRDNFDFGTVPSRSAGTSIRKSADREQTPDNMAKDNLDFGMESSYSSSGGVIRKSAEREQTPDNSIKNSFEFGTESSHISSKRAMRKSAEREQTPDNSIKDSFEFRTEPSHASSRPAMRKSAEREQKPDNSIKDSFEFRTEPSHASSRPAMRKSAEREQTPDNSVKDSFDFGTEPSHASSRHGTRKSSEREQIPDNSIEDSFDLGKEPSHAFSRQATRKSVERQQTPDNANKETEVLTPLPFSEAPASTLGKGRDLESPAAIPAFEVEAVDVQREEPACPPLGVSPSVSEARLQSEAQPQRLKQAAPDWSPAQTEPKPEAPREAQVKKKSRSGKNRANKRRSWGQDNDTEEAVSHFPSGESRTPSVPSVSQDDSQKNTVDQPESRSISKEQLPHIPPPTQRQPEVTIPTTSPLFEKEKSPHTQVLMQPEAPKPVISAFVNKEKPRRGERSRDPEPQVVKEPPSMPLAVPKEKTARQQHLQQQQQQLQQQQQQLQQQQKAVSRSTPAREIPQIAPGAPSPCKEEDQLDFLLSLRKPATATQPLNFAAPTSAVRAAIDQDESVAATPPPVAEKKTEDLEDWLDSMLDD